MRQEQREEFSRRIAQSGMDSLRVTHDEAEVRAIAQQAWRLREGLLEGLW